MPNDKTSPAEAIAVVCQPLAGLPACIAGSTVAAETYGMPLHTSSDIDVFCFSEQALIAGVQLLLTQGFELSERFERVWERWLQYGLRNWHTNSLKLLDPNGYEVNLVYKLTGGHPLTSLAAVLESFDFGLLATGYDLKLGQRMDLRSFLFPDLDPNGPLPMMPHKRADWINGFISQYNGLREMGRYAKYAQYGYDLSRVKDDLITGYQQAAIYLLNRDEPEKQQLGDIYFSISLKIESDSINEMHEASKEILTLDSLDAIMEALE